MAACSLCHLLPTNQMSSPNPLKKKPTRRNKHSMSCRSQGGKKREKQDARDEKRRLWGLMEWKESMSPKRRGDWKDLILMSLSFALCVYISQKIVSAYCTWVSILKRPF